VDFGGFFAARAIRRGCRRPGREIKAAAESRYTSRMVASTSRPPFIVSSADVPETTHRYPKSDEPMAPSRAIGHTAGLLKIGLHVQRVPPGARISWPHAEEKEEEFVYVVDGEVDAWVDGALHRMKAGDLAAFPAGTGICHTFLNNGAREATLLVGGEASRADNRIFYPLHPGRRDDMPWSQWWDDHPVRPQGSHDGEPDTLRASERSPA
jgi:uncharacterized cupin superfamily protein